LNQPRPLISILGFLLCATLLLGLVWGIYRFAEKNISGEGFFIQWVGIRALLTAGEDPYSDTATAKIRESVIFENSFSQGNAPKYTSPLYSGIVVFPAALIGNRTVAHAFWLSTQLIAISLIQLLALRLSGWKPAWVAFLIFSLLTTFSYHVLIPWLDGGSAIWAALFLMLALLAIRNNWYELGGILLALAAIQPQMSILVIIFTFIWAASQRKYILVIWFFITLIILSVIGIFIVPDWIRQYIRLLYNYPANFPPGNPAALFTSLWPGLGRQLGWVVTALSSLVLIVEWWRARKKDFRWFLWTACLTLAVGQWIGIPIIPGNFISLLIPLILFAALLSEHWLKGGPWVVVVISLILFSWEWALYYRDITSANAGMQLNLLIPLPLILILGLYWVRWWATKPRRLLIEELRFGQSY